VLCCLALPIWPFGTSFALAILRQIRKGEHPRLLSREYESLVRRTDRLNQRTSIMTWIALALICLLIVLVIVIAQWPAEMRHLR
jgi:hypothetical protein